ncbi:EAL domain-containing protein [Noviherbaspirillum cavernae]|uniref:EAL domain-containing protein n=1 Tax=Noviherbaspirillum cavernae TaxID=2320862 RepID=A0A418WVY3_9BURK|nr:EAL domain-containing protein [Noviherbaspirillum cavernae]RJF96813.1 EAL domain-containing protein [Noviherbaspirillum cavernae]
MKIDSLDRDDERLRHLVAMYAVLNATNEAILRATVAPELYERVCHAAVDGGKFRVTAIAIPDADSGAIKVVAVAGTQAQKIGGGAGISIDADSEQGQGLVGLAYRSGVACHSNDFLNDERTRPWHDSARRGGIHSGAAVPLLLDERVIGVLVFYSIERNAFDAETIELIERMARNISFALGNFAREAERRKAEQALRESEEKYRNILETIEDAYYEVDRQGNYVLVNRAFCRMVGYDESEVIGRSYRDFQSPEVAVRVLKAFNEVYQTGVPSNGYDWETIRKDGRKVVSEGSVKLIVNADGEPSGFRGMLRDVTERRKVERALRESEARFRGLTNLSTDWYWEQDSEFRYTRMDSRHTNVMATQRSFLGRRPWETELEIQAGGGWDAHRVLLDGGESFRDVIMYRLLPGGRPYYISVSGEPVVDNEGQFLGYRGVSREITEQKIAEERIQFLATHDGLTRLPNRLMFSELVNHAISTSQRHKRNFAVLFIDLDRFKFVNDTLGHEAGDRLLKEIAARFKQVLRASDVLARLGGDEFVILIQESEDSEQIAVVARRILSAALKPIMLMGQECRVTASIGIATFPEHGQDEQTLMKNADIAMYYAKEEGKNNFQFYSTDIKTLSLERLTLEANLRHAMEHDEFSLHYQAKLDLKKGSITGVEALLRWQNAELGSVAPNRFIPVAEETGMIVPIGKWVLRTACEQNMAWQRQGLPPICVAVNLSVRQFADENLLGDIAAVLAETGLAPHLLEIEITEGMVVHHPERAIKLLTAIKAMGVRLAIDDFGTGYSSLGQLKNFPIDTLKVDRSFIRDIATSADDKAITEAIIAMGKTLSLTVVAEGVETMEQEAFLREHACDEMQGYYFSKPIAADEFTALLKTHLQPG